MNRRLTLAVLVPFLAAAAVAQTAADRVAALNAAIVDALRPFNDQSTRASLNFRRVETNASRAVAVSLALDYSKTGPGGQASIKVPDLTYSFPEGAGARPVTSLRGAIALDLTRVIPQAQIDQLGSQADELVKQFIASYTREFGQAATVSAQVTHKEHDAQGHLTSLGLTLDADVSLAKLPAGKDPKSVLLTGLHVAADITLKGADLSVRVVSNPGANEFAQGQTGLKETLDKLLARDPKAIASITDLMRTLGQAADYVTRAPGAS